MLGFSLPLVYACALGVRD